jgi:hypothetical protein
MGKQSRQKRERLRERESATIEKDVEFALVGSGPLEGSAGLIICARIGDAPFVPPRYEIADCHECKRPVWINPEIVEAIEARKMVVIPMCTKCCS